MSGKKCQVVSFKYLVNICNGILAEAGLLNEVETERNEFPKLDDWKYAHVCKIRQEKLGK